MLAMMGARNTRGFSSCVDNGKIPASDHITYEGVFNQLKFQVGPKTNKTVDCHIGYARYQFPQSLYDKKMNDYLCLFLKSQRDGSQRTDMPLNAVICLDISGSMQSRLQGSSGQSRLKLSVQAIKMFISKLRPDDSVGVVTFNNKAQIIFEQTYKKDFNSDFYNLLDQIKVSGGTTISSGLGSSRKMLKEFIKQNQTARSQNRIIMLTDVCDNSFGGTQNFVRQASINDNIHLTIVGVSNQFKSSTCQRLKNVKGFNYFCAINDQDIKKNIFEQFDFNFFPVAHDIEVKLYSDNVVEFDTYGAPDSNQERNYNHEFQKDKNNIVQFFSSLVSKNGNKQNVKQYIITRTASIFPSQIQIICGNVYTVGGVILIKLQKKQQTPYFKGELQITYRNLEGQKRQQNFLIDFKFPQKQQFYSQECLRQALEGYSFTSQMKNILKKLNKKQQKMSKKQLAMYLGFFDCLEKVTPQSKKKDVDGVKNIIRKKIQNLEPAKQ